MELLGLGASSLAQAVCCSWEQRLAIEKHWQFFLLVYSERVPKLASLSVWGDRKHKLIFHLEVKQELVCQVQAQGGFAVPPVENSVLHFAVGSFLSQHVIASTLLSGSSRGEEVVLLAGTTASWVSSLMVASLGACHQSCAGTSCCGGDSREDAETVLGMHPLWNAPFFVCVCFLGIRSLPPLGTEPFSGRFWLCWGAWDFEAGWLTALPLLYSQLNFLVSQAGGNWQCVVVTTWLPDYCTC